MNDTSVNIKKKLKDFWMARSGSERLVMGCAMFDDAKIIAQAGIQARHLHENPSEISRLLFQLLYANDFAPSKFQKILKTIFK